MYGRNEWDNGVNVCRLGLKVDQQMRVGKEGESESWHTWYSHTPKTLVGEDSPIEKSLSLTIKKYSPWVWVVLKVILIGIRHYMNLELIVKL